jgi:hypothetical protein
MKKDGCPIRRYRRPPQRCRAQPCSLSRPSAIGVVRRASPSYVATGRSRLHGQRAHGLWRKICPRGCVFHPRRSDNTSHQSAASTIAVRSSSDYGAVSRDNARNERAERGPSMSGPMNSYIPGNPGHACRRRRGLVPSRSGIRKRNKPELGLMIVREDRGQGAVSV